MKKRTPINITKELFDELISSSCNIEKCIKAVKDYRLNKTPLTLYNMLPFYRGFTYEDYIKLRPSSKEDVKSKEFLDLIAKNPNNIRECCRIYGKKHFIDPYGLMNCYQAHKHKIKPLFYIYSSKKIKLYNTKNILK
jgi:hypothetical protein